jgi:hypothetical protein
LEKLLYVGGVLGSGEVQVSHQLVGMVIWFLSWLLSVVRPHGGSRVLLGTCGGHGDVLISILSSTARPLVANAEKIQLGLQFRKNSGRNSGSGPFSGILSPGVTEIRLLDIAFFRYFSVGIKEM